MFWLIIYRAFQYLCALFIGFSLIGVFTRGISYLFWGTAIVFLYFAWKNQADEIKNELGL